MTPSRGAAFLDRDGTLVVDQHYLAQAGRMRLVPGAADAVRRLNDAGVPVVVVTNQSGIARGLMTPAEYELTRSRLEELVAAAGARITATYHCPHFPDVSGPCECRKPGTLLYRRAARDHDLDVQRSLYAGDRMRDVIPGQLMGGLAVLVPSPETPAEDLETARREALVLATLGEAVERFLEWERERRDA
jgi:D-glycero-D-manno-heptose 1,7-bisphosphate phosphatase